MSPRMRRWKIYLIKLKLLECYTINNTQWTFYLSTEIPEEMTVCVSIVGMQLRKTQDPQVLILIIQLLIYRA